MVAHTKRIRYTGVVGGHPAFETIGAEGAFADRV